jgi:hypothetical protein
MGMKRDRRIGQAHAEQLLRGDATVGGGLADVLTAASAPGRPEELCGEDAAAVAFRAARARGRTPELSRRRAVSAVATLVTTKLAALALLVGAGGVAVAASAGVLPATPWHHQDPNTLITNRPSRQPAVAPPTQPSPSSSGSAASPDGASLRAVRAACEGLLYSSPPATADPAFASLIAAAGGASHVRPYCTELLDTAPGTATDDPSSGTADGSGGRPEPMPHPTGKLSGPPPGEPSERPGSEPATRPGGPPPSQGSH